MNIPRLNDISHCRPYEIELPPMWTRVPSGSKFLAAYHYKKTYRVVASIDMLDGEYIHISVSKRQGKPSWQDLQMVKNLFIGKENEAVQVFPRESDLVDTVDAYHLWHKID